MKSRYSLLVVAGAICASFGCNKPPLSEEEALRTEKQATRFVVGRISHGVENSDPRGVQPRLAEELKVLLPFVSKEAQFDDNSVLELVSPPNEYFYIDEVVSDRQRRNVLLFDRPGNLVWPYKVPEERRHAMLEVLSAVAAGKSTDTN